MGCFVSRRDDIRGFVPRIVWQSGNGRGVQPHSPTKQIFIHETNSNMPPNTLSEPPEEWYIFVIRGVKYFHTNFPRRFFDMVETVWMWGEHPADEDELHLLIPNPISRCMEIESPKRANIFWQSLYTTRSPSLQNHPPKRLLAKRLSLCGSQGCFWGGKYWHLRGFKIITLWNID